MTVLSLVLIVTILALLLMALMVAGLSRHKKSATRALNLLGATGLIESTLDPEGAVIVDGELWRARGEDGSALQIRNRVRVVGAQAHLLIVAPISNKS